jgi:hypothetical protein
VGGDGGGTCRIAARQLPGASSAIARLTGYRGPWAAMGVPQTTFRFPRKNAERIPFSAQYCRRRFAVLMLAAKGNCMSKYVTFNIAIPTDADGFVGRACDAPGCKQYFKIYVPDHADLRDTAYAAELAHGTVSFPSGSEGRIERLRFKKGLDAGLEGTRSTVPGRLDCQ